MSVVVDPWGRILDTLPLFEKTYKTVDVPVYREEGFTFYARWGDWLPVVFLALLFLTVVLDLLPPRKPTVV
jgi:apolipoprotein N-acyltransferase